MDGFRRMGTMDEFRQSGQMRPLFGGSSLVIRPVGRQPVSPDGVITRCRLLILRPLSNAESLALN